MSAPMINWVPLVSRAYKYITSVGFSTQSIDLKPVEIHDIETAPEKRPRTLKHLIKANHINHSILYHEARFHNHLPHHLGSAYLLGADLDQLHKVYDEESKTLEEWKDSPGEMTDADWREFLGDKRYQRAYVDFFEDELALKFSYDWKALIEEYLYSGKAPLVNALTSGRELQLHISLSCFKETDRSFNSRPPSNPPWLRRRARQPHTCHRSPLSRKQLLRRPTQIPRRSFLHPSLHLRQHLTPRNTPQNPQRHPLRRTLHGTLPLQPLNPLL